MSLRGILITIIGVLLHPAVSLWAQQDVLRFHDVSVADALTTVNEHYPDNSIHFVRNELDTLRIASLMVRGQDVLDDITRIIGKYPIGLKIFGNHIFVEYRHERQLPGNGLQLLPAVDDDDIAYERILHEVMVSQTFPRLGLEGPILSLRIANTPLAVAGSASDLLAYLPGVQFGVPGTVIRIDGKPVTSYNELTELSSEEVDRIDYSDQPQYTSRQHAIIDIRTHRQREDGYGIHMASQYSQGRRGRAMQLVKTNIHQGRWDLQLSGAYRYDGIDKDLSINEYLFHDCHEQNSFHVSIGSEYQLGSHTTLGLQYRFLSMLNPISQKRVNLIFDFDSGNLYSGFEICGPNNQTLQRIRDWQLDYQPQHDVNVYLKASWGAWDVNTAASFYHDGVNLSELNATNLLPEHRTNEVLNTLWAVKADAQRPLWHGRLQLMAEYSHTGRDDVYHRMYTQPFTSSYLRRQNRWSGSLSYRRKTDRIEGAMGMLAEVVDTYPNFPIAFPFADVSLLGRKARLSLSYAMRSSMPTYGQTNGFAYHNIEMLGIEGEPDLRPSLSHHLQLKALTGRFYGTIGWQRVSDYIVQSVENRDQGEYVASFHNIDVANLYTASINYHHTLQQWSSQYAVSFHGQQLHFGQREFGRPIVRLQWNNQVQLPYGITALLNAAYHTSGHEGATWQQQSGQLDLALIKETRNWTLQLRTDDLLHTAATRTIYYGRGSEYNRRCYTDNQRIQLTLRINLGSLSRHSLRSLNAGSSERERL